MAEIQLLVDGAGNRRALTSILDDNHTPVVDEELREVDLYLVDEPSFHRYSDALERRKRELDPVFCPVVLVRRDQTPVTVDLPDVETAERPLVVDDVVTAPVEPASLFRTISNLLARRNQTAELHADLRAQNDELRQFKNAVEHAGHAILITDPDGVIEYVNPAFERMTGYAAAEVIGENPRILKSGEQDESLYRELWHTIRDGDIWTGELVNERKSGERFVINQTIAPIADADGEIQAFVGIQDDITAHKLREQQLTVFHRILRHNLRNKGTVINGYAAELEASLDDDAFVEHLRTIQENVQLLLETSEKAHRIQRIFGDSLDEDTERGLMAALEQIADEVGALYPDAEIAIEGDRSESVRIDARAIPAFRELVENAVKHSESAVPRAAITARTESATATVTIADNGPGIPDQERRVIEAETEKPLEHGSRLGLWFAYWVITYVGGDIDLETTADGTTVSVTLPVTR
ncbi:PAS domain S-box protein [Halorussus marinus]|uniref:PAS domain S-box protein n=1 Tax=Halorussus marinus TaxID=2505976 RepID=UPI00106E6653|nr:PAS domain S-box protein [Halorussus marinus]